MDPDKIIDHLLKELSDSLKAMSKTKVIEEKVQYSQVVKHLSESFSVFMELASNFMEFDEDFDLDE